MRAWLLAFPAMIAATSFLSASVAAQNHSERPESSDIRIPITDGCIQWHNLCDQPFFSKMPMAGELKKVIKAQAADNAYVPADIVILLLKLSGSQAKVELAENSNEPTAIVIDRDHVTSQSEAWKLAMFRAMGDASSGGINGIVPLPDTWGKSAKSISNPERIVIVLGGYRSKHLTSAQFAKSLHEQTGLPMAVYFYPTSVDLQTNINQFQTMLREFALTKPNCRITLIGHSMGAMVARGAIERNTDQAPFAVDQLIQIFPPNHGSVLAELTEATEGTQLLSTSAASLVGLIKPLKGIERGEGNSFDVLMGLALNGFGAASRDLRPDSEFLRQFNELPRNPKVSYSILAGSEGPMPRLISIAHWLNEGELDALKAKADPLTRALTTQATRYANADELKAGLGDGAVTVKSARLDGVADFKIVSSNHFEWYRTDTAGGKAVLGSTLDRLKKE